MVTLQQLLFMQREQSREGRGGVPDLVEVGAEGTRFEAEMISTLTQHGVTGQPTHLRYGPKGRMFKTTAKWDVLNVLRSGPHSAQLRNRFGDTP